MDLAERVLAYYRSREGVYTLEAITHSDGAFMIEIRAIINDNGLSDEQKVKRIREFVTEKNRSE